MKFKAEVYIQAKLCQLASDDFISAEGLLSGTVKTLEDGSVDINIDIYNGTTLDVNLAYTDTATDTVEETKTVDSLYTVGYILSPSTCANVNKNAKQKLATVAQIGNITNQSKTRNKCFLVLYLISSNLTATFLFTLTKT